MRIEKYVCHSDQAVEELLDEGGAKWGSVAAISGSQVITGRVYCKKNLSQYKDMVQVTGQKYPPKLSLLNNRSLSSIKLKICQGRTDSGHLVRQVNKEYT
jgi:hypothetical protein